MFIRRLAVLTYLLCLALGLSAQQHAGRVRPKIGLVLGGGGARGLAHIGVLEWLEEHRIPVDYVAGTSMGGLIGGLYSMGMKPAQLRDLVNRIDWEELLAGIPSYQQSLLRRKEDRREYPGLQLGWDKGIRLGTGLNGGHFVRLIFDRVALPYWKVHDFDELPIPFRCVATDLVSTNTVVLKDGAIAEALRATMAIPGAFTPVRRRGAILIDGGVLNNLPSDVVRAMGADVVIAVNVGTPLRESKGLQSLVGILDQTISLAGAQKLRENLSLADVVLTPDLGSHTAMSFTAGKDLEQAGYDAAALSESELRKFEVEPAEWERYSSVVSRRVRRAVPAPQSVVVEAPTPNEVKAIQTRLQRYRGVPLDADSLENDLAKILGWGRYTSLNYEVRAASDKPDNPELVVHAEPLLNKAAIVRVGLGVQGAETQQVEVNVRSQTTVFDVGGYGSELRVDASLGTTLLYGIEYYRPLAKSRFFVAPHALASRALINLSASKDNVVSYRRSSAGAGIDLGYGVLSQTDEVRLGYEIRHERNSVKVGTPILPVYNGTSNAFSLRWFHDDQDSPTVPRRGIRSTLRGSWFLDSASSSCDFPQAEVNSTLFQPIDGRGSVFAMMSAGTTFNRTAPFGNEMTLGGPMRLSSYGLEELRGSDYAMVGLGYVRRLNQSTFARLYAFGMSQVGRVFRPQSPDRTGMDFTAGFIADSYIGPVMFGVAVGDAGHHTAFISIGHTF